MKLIFATIICLLISACDRPSEKSSIPEQQQKTSKVSSRISLDIQNASPDQAVKTWWAYLDMVEQDAVNSCNQDKASDKPKHVEYLQQIAAGELLAAKTPVERDCTQSTFNREIDEVKTESETRAIVFATIKNNTPLPPGAELDGYDKKWRSNGFKFKYLVEKSAGVWKVSQVYKFDESNKLINKDVWEKNYVRRDKPHVPAYISVQ